MQDRAQNGERLGSIFPADLNLSRLQGNWRRIKNCSLRRMNVNRKKRYPSVWLPNVRGRYNFIRPELSSNSTPSGKYSLAILLSRVHWAHMHTIRHFVRRDKIKKRICIRNKAARISEKEVLHFTRFYQEGNELDGQEREASNTRSKQIERKNFLVYT